MGNENVHDKSDLDSPVTERVLDKKRSDYIGWDEYFMALVFLTAQRSKDPCTQVGACIVDENNVIIGVGYNGMPRNCDDDKFPWGKNLHTLENKHLYVCHAETNAIMNKNSSSLAGCRMYVGLYPCNACAKIIIQSGIKTVIYMSNKHANKLETQASKIMFEAASIECRQYIPNRSKIEINFDDIDWNKQNQVPPSPMKTS